ncbi:MAG: helix-turn-helix domain-containing protein [Myxococcales bacterium]|nr:helix-turn-helix domain-containing protein [Myxococcales bacterium]
MIKLRNCVRCESDRLEDANVERLREVSGHVFSTVLPARRCGNCGEEYFEGVDLVRFDLAVARALADAAVFDGPAVLFMRKALGLLAKDLAALLAVRAETVSRWENGKTPLVDRPVKAVLHQLVTERATGASTTESYLRSLVKPRRLAKRVKVATEATAGEDATRE